MTRFALCFGFHACHTRFGMFPVYTCYIVESLLSISDCHGKLCLTLPLCSPAVPCCFNEVPVPEGLFHPRESFLPLIKIVKEFILVS